MTRTIGQQAQKHPKVTVLMSVYNSEDYLVEAVESILNQTYKNFEFLIINDGSTDSSLRILREFSKRDSRIRLISRRNKGLVASLNEGLEKARGDYLARMDSDDISLPHRLATEVTYLDNNPDVVLVGSNYTVINENGKKLTTTNIFTHPDDLKVAQVTCNQYGHGSIMARRKALLAVGGYDPRVGHVEDYHLWTRLSRKYKIANIVDPLYLYRSNSQGVSQSNLNLQIKQTFAVRDAAFKHFLKNRRDYRIYGWHPSGRDYRRRKAVLLRNYSYLFRVNNKKIYALQYLLLAFLLEPTRKINLRYIKHTLGGVDIKHWEYEFL